MMKIKWRDYNEGWQRPESSAFVNAIVLRARKVDGAWRAWISIGGLRVLSEDNCASREEAKAAAEEMLRELVTPFVDAAPAEAALAEREACAAMVQREREKRERFAEGSPTPQFYGGQAAVLGLTVGAIRARTTPATLSTETLAAIAEARGLRVVEPELLAGLEPPVLQWDNNDGHWSAFIGPWRVTATEGSWSLCVVGGERGSRTEVDYGRKSDTRSNRLAAEAALRSLGVAFRVGEDGAK